MILATPDDRFYRLKPEMKLGEKDAAMLDGFNADVARHARVSLAQLPVMPVSSTDYPFTLSSVYHGFTMAAANVRVLIKSVAREMDISNNYIPQNPRTSQVARCQS